MATDKAHYGAATVVTDPTLKLILLNVDGQLLLMVLTFWAMKKILVARFITRSEEVL